MKSPYKSQIVPSDNYQVTFILSQQVFEVTVFSDRRAAVHSTWSIALPMTQCRPDQITQQPGDAKVHILIENLYKFKGFETKKLICEFFYKGWNVKV